MLEKRVLPLNNPLLEKRAPASYLTCNYCPFITKFSGALNRHVSRYHERELALEGGKGLGKGGDLNQRIQESLLRRGYVRCKYWTVPCPAGVNPLMARVCQHISECP